MPKDKKMVYVVRDRQGHLATTTQNTVRRGFKALDVPNGLNDAGAATFLAKNFPKNMPVLYCAHDGLINGFFSPHKPITVAELPASVKGMRRSIDWGKLDLAWQQIYSAETAKVYLTSKAAGLKTKCDEYVIECDAKSDLRKKLKGLVHGQEVLLIDIC